MTIRRRSTVLAAIVLSGCHQAQPTGQVIAVVNGDEITRGEMRAESVAGSLPQDASAVVQTLVERRIFAQEARRIGLDRQVDFVLARHRAEDALLANLLQRTIADAIPPPTDQEIDHFLATHPAAFFSSTVFDVEQIDFAPGDNRAASAIALKQPTLDDAERVLVREGIAYQRSKTQWNSLFMPAALARTLQSLGLGKTFTRGQSDTAVIAVLLAQNTTPLDYRHRQIFARKLLRQRLIAAAVEQRLAQLRAAADIRYQSGFGPMK